MTKKNELAAFGGQITQANRENDAGLGSTNVTADDLSTPQIKLLQQSSPEVKKHDSAYVEGAEAGMFLNTATKQLFTSVYVMNLWFDKKFNIWNDDDMLVEALETEAAAKEYAETEKLDMTKHNIVETHTHTLLLLDDTGSPLGAALTYMSRSKLPVSKDWNTAIAEYEKRGKARFSYIWQLTSALSSNKKNQEFFNISPKLFKVDDAAVEAPDALYDAAKAELNIIHGVGEQKAA